MRALFSHQVVTPSGVEPATICIESGTITHVLPNRIPEAVDLGHWTISPGIVDTHVHINEPGRTDWEGYTTATQAAVAGGITTLVDMPLNCLPVTTTAEALRLKMEAIREKMWVDCGFWGGVVPESLPHLPALLQAGVLGVKSFLIDSGIPEFPPMDATHLRPALATLRHAKKPYLIHAELDLGAQVPPGDARSYRRFLASRPPDWEQQAIETMIALCRETGGSVHIVHLSHAGALTAIRTARSQGLPFSVETCPHYLVLEADTIPDGTPIHKCCPPIREHANRESLWQGLAEGVIDMVVSDHSPCLPALKELERGDLEQAWGGIASLQFSLPLVWTECRNRGYSLNQLAQWMSAAPAVLCGLGDIKGRIAPGYRADLVVWDPEQQVRITIDSIRHRHKETPYLDRLVFGQVKQTWLGGTCIFDEGTIIDQPIGQKIMR